MTAPTLVIRITAAPEGGYAFVDEKGLTLRCRSTLEEITMDVMRQIDAAFQRSPEEIASRLSPSIARTGPAPHDTKGARRAWISDWLPSQTR